MADAVLVPASQDDAQRIAAVLGVERAFAIEARYQPVRVVGGPDPRSPIPDPRSRVIAVSGIARPQRFVDAVRTLGWDVAEQMAFPDHHWFDERDVARVESAATASGATAVITTEKDAVRLAGVNRTMTWVYVPLRVALMPEDQFRIWMLDRIQNARERIGARSTAGG
jgi:tetraacyldisaccharide 4'-kinase